MDTLGITEWLSGHPTIHVFLMRLDYVFKKEHIVILGESLVNTISMFQPKMLWNWHLTKRQSSPGQWTLATCRIGNWIPNLRSPTFIFVVGIRQQGIWYCGIIQILAGVLGMGGNKGNLVRNLLLLWLLGWCRIPEGGLFIGNLNDMHGSLWD